jgi:hypothetical protein
MRFPKKLLGIILVAFYAVLSIAPSVGAESTISTQGMQISPTLLEINAEAGNEYEVSVNVTNITDTDLVYSSSIDDFNSNNETGSPHIISNEDLPETASIKTWVTPITDFVLASHDSKNISAMITVPTNAEPGGHYGVIRFSGGSSNVDTNGVGLSASAGVLVLIRVGSDDQIIEKADLASFNVEKDDKQSWLFENGPITFVSRIQNNGNVHVKPSGSIEVRDMFGGLTATMDVNTKDPKSNVLPNSIRRFESALNTKWMFGQYTATITLGYGTKGQAITNTIKFWVIPYKLILIGLFILFTVGFVLKRLVAVYNGHIVKKSKNENNKKKGTS